jgi:RNA polymerase sigma factor (sigma-70 family)
MNGLRPATLASARRRISIIRRRMPDRSTPENTATQIEAYLRGAEDRFLEVDVWIRTQLRTQYPALLDEEEDLCQIVHGKLLVNLREDRFRGQSSLRSYVSGITHYSAVDRLRSRYRDRELHEALKPEHAEIALDNPYRDLERVGRARLLHRVVVALPAACRELWRLVFVENLSYPEIAEELSIPPGTVKSRMWHCRRKATSILRRLTLRDH